MNIYCDGFNLDGNPGTTGGYTVADENGKLLSIKFIKKQHLTNNEVELRGIQGAALLAKEGWKIITDSRNSIHWINRAMKGRKLVARPELTDLAIKIGQQINYRKLKLVWGPREGNWAGKINEDRLLLSKALKKNGIEEEIDITQGFPF